MLYKSIRNLLKSNNLKLKNNLWFIVSEFETIFCSALSVYAHYFVSRKSASLFYLLFIAILAQNLFFKSVGEIITKNEVKIKLEDSFAKKVTAIIIATTVFISAGLIAECVYFYRSNNRAITGLTLNYDSEYRKAIESVLSEYEVSA